MRKARTKAATQQVATSEPDVFDEAIDAQRKAQAATVIHQVADSTVMPTDHAPGYIANPSSTVRVNGHVEAIKKRTAQPHSKTTFPAGDMIVHLIDKGENEAGIGIRVEFPQGAKNRPNEEEKAIIRRHVKGEEGQESGFAWKGDFGMWHKDIGRDSSPNRAVAIRLDAESRVQKLADALKHHAIDPSGYAERIQQEREHAPEGRIPD
jgi:hypothetical protein